MKDLLPTNKAWSGTTMCTAHQHRPPAPRTSATHQRHSMLRSVGALQTVRTNTQRGFKRARENGQTTRGFSAKYLSINFKLFIQVHFLLFPAHQTYSTGWIASKYRQPWTAHTTYKMTHPDQLSPLYLLIPPPTSDNWGDVFTGMILFKN